MEKAPSVWAIAAILAAFANALAVHSCSVNAVNGRGADIGRMCLPLTGTQRDVNGFKHTYVLSACVCVSVDLCA